jgi:putative membrane protein
MKRTAWAMTWVHVVAMIFGLFGILVAIPHPELWANQPSAATFYAFVIDKTGGVGMILGAIAMLCYGFWAIGARRTLLFFIASCLISAAAELTGTKTGWPFGGYEYTNFLGAKLLGRVPFPIPLSWFYMGFASFMLGDAIARMYAPRNRNLVAVVLGTYLLTAWDLVLDPSMASPTLQYVHFWIWHETGPYFGMPLRNLVGWFGTGLVFIAVGRALWMERVSPAPSVVIPLTVYTVNVVWSMILSVAAGMWPTAIAAIVLSLLPASFAVVQLRAKPGHASTGSA